MHTWSSLSGMVTWEKPVKTSGVLKDSTLEEKNEEITKINETFELFFQQQKLNIYIYSTAKLQIHQRNL